MHGEELPIQYTAKRESIETFTEPVISFLVIFIETFTSEIEKTCHLSTFVITPQYAHCFWEVGLEILQIWTMGNSYFECEEEKEHFYAETTSINKISQKQVFCVFRRPSDLKNFQKIVELTMNVSYYSNRVCYSQ